MKFSFVFKIKFVRGGGHRKEPRPAQGSKKLSLLNMPKFFKLTVPEITGWKIPIGIKNLFTNWKPPFFEKSRTVPKSSVFSIGNGCFSTCIEKTLISSTGPKNNQRGHPYDSEKDFPQKPQKTKTVKLF